MSGRRSNREILTGGKKYIQKQGKKFGVDEVVFDKDSRQDYLTGFHKRKVQRQKKAQVYIKEQERLARIEERKRIRDERKQDLQEQLTKFNETVKEITHYMESGDEEEDDSWDGFKDDLSVNKDSENGPEDSGVDDKGIAKAKPVPRGILRHEEVYKIEDPTSFAETDAVIDEDTTVTVESMDNPMMASIQQISLEAKAKANFVDLSKADEILDQSIKRAQNYAVITGAAKPSHKDKVKRKKFRYLTKTERRDNNSKQKLKKLKSRKRALD
ncbi:hypothetical protein PSN45_001798 [Yamadazyma tenuis]|uniref:Ribosomal RNA-processing protein 17 n=1 Tax=Candida tenuis (strain ATCC 10573 / BCRC 21748 / CBS 615 / JCM 9827 / NBRC 10315 / NRRL Y-1498 / VKM Y-70) TaxID=590646 RepID=G3BE28_CANTC|nr:uncharacterized protein CANTEDRAFT_116495 [Yamadazyma tenuis ATCC 10573]EGV60442.1 hypothetical protein CANTEDRAFT_116495 [Yamadazyma tenuis ATCC 10573]WEJ94314.1 hypothetical protein PSN45_001798 [Yamadazyma tenuis]